MNYIYKIAVVTNANSYDGNTFSLHIERVGDLVLTKEVTNGNRNIYITSCYIPYQYLLFNQTNNELSFFGSVNEDDEGYNHCYDLCNNGLLLPAPAAEKTYSIFTAFAPNYHMYQNAITFYIV